MSSRVSDFTHELNAETLRREFYNARVVDLERVHDDLMILRIESDEGPLRFSAGQYTVLGLGSWEPRLSDTQPETPEPGAGSHLIKRAYSISARLFDDFGQLVPATRDSAAEFYVALVRRAAARPPALTPRLFHLKVGDRLYMSSHTHGKYGIDGVDADQNIVLAATGTGEAPHNAMLSELLQRGHRGRIVMATCVRYRKDLAYLQKHRRLETLFPNYRYLALTTREPENLDPTLSSYVGKRYLQDYFGSGEFERDAGLLLDPSKTHVYLCGAPEMIGAPIRTHQAESDSSSPQGMVEILERRGFQIDVPHQSGNLHFEKFW